MKNIGYLLFLIMFLLILISCTSTVVPNSGHTNSIPEDFIGLVHAGDPEKLDEYPLINEMGAIWLLQTFRWSGIEREQGNFNFDYYDSFVDNAKLNNKKVIAVLAYDSNWLDQKKEFYISSKNLVLFLNYMEETVKRYKGRVDAWQIWNEPNFFKFWRGTNKEFYKLSKLAAQKIREIDPNAYIIGGGFLRTPNKFLEDMHKAGCFENTNAISFHPYAMSPEGAMKLYDNLIKINNDFGYKGDIWITEIGFPTSGWYPHKVSLDKLPSYVVKTIVGAAIRNSRALLWYELSDYYNKGEEKSKFNSEDFFGLTYPNRTRKNGAYAYQLCATYLSGSKYNPNLPIRENVSSNIFNFYFKNEKSDINTLVLWNDKNSSQRIRITVPYSFKIHNISTGESTEMKNDNVLHVTKTPVFITWQGESTVTITGVKK